MMQNTAGGWPSLGSGGAAGGNSLLGLPFGSAYAGGGPTRASGVFAALDSLINRISNCPWSASAGSLAPCYQSPKSERRPLYTPEERRRRDSTPWTLVQGILAPVQFLVFLVSVGLVLNYLLSGEGETAATLSVLVKTLVLYTIMVTGAIWEKVVFGKYLFAPSFFWEDAVSMLVIGLHTAYLVALIDDFGSVEDRMLLALAAYATYAINATQFILKLRAARLQAPRADRMPEAGQVR